MAKLTMRIGNGLSDLIRDTFWFDPNFEWAINTFYCFQGISSRHVDSILAGNARLVPDKDGKNALLKTISDRAFKKRLKDQLKFNQAKLTSLRGEREKERRTLEVAEYGLFSDYCRQSHFDKAELSKFRLKEFDDKITVLEDWIQHYNRVISTKVTKVATVKIGKHEVPKHLLDEYTHDVVKRLRMVVKSPGIAMAMDPLEMLDLENTRRELHDKIIESVGLSKKRKGDEYFDFSDALEKHLEKEGAGMFKKGEII